MSTTLFFRAIIAMTTSFVLSAKASSLDEIMSKPLVLGASVSQGYLTESPGKVLAKRFTEERNLRTIAFNGSPAVNTLSHTSSESFADRSVVIAVDLFFWDSIRPQGEDSLRVMRRLFAEVKARNIPLVIGDVPHLLPQFQPQAGVLNGELRKLCERNTKCSILPLDQMAKELLRTGYLDYGGKRYSRAQLLPDGLHVSAVASNYLADEIGKRLLDK